MLLVVWILVHEVGEISLQFFWEGLYHLLGRLCHMHALQSLERRCGLDLERQRACVIVLPLKAVLMIQPMHAMKPRWVATWARRWLMVSNIHSFVFISRWKMRFDDCDVRRSGWLLFAHLSIQALGTNSNLVVSTFAIAYQVGWRSNWCKVYYLLLIQA